MPTQFVFNNSNKYLRTADCNNSKCFHRVGLLNTGLKNENQQTK